MICGWGSLLHKQAKGREGVLTTDLSMALMRLWLMSNVVRVLQTGMTAVIGRSDISPSASHSENSFASGTSINCRQPEGYQGLSASQKPVASSRCPTIMLSVLWWMLRVRRFALIQDRP